MIGDYFYFGVFSVRIYFTSYDPALLETLAPGIPASVDGTPEVEEGSS